MRLHTAAAEALLGGVRKLASANLDGRRMGHAIAPLPRTSRCSLAGRLQVEDVVCAERRGAGAARGELSPGRVRHDRARACWRARDRRRVRRGARCALGDQSTACVSATARGSLHRGAGAGDDGALRHAVRVHRPDAGRVRPTRVCRSPGDRADRGCRGARARAIARRAHRRDAVEPIAVHVRQCLVLGRTGARVRARERRTQ